jgi:hypothetical protein
LLVCAKNQVPSLMCFIPCACSLWRTLPISKDKIANWGARDAVRRRSCLLRAARAIVVCTRIDHCVHTERRTFMAPRHGSDCIFLSSIWPRLELSRCASRLSCIRAVLFGAGSSSLRRVPLRTRTYLWIRRCRATISQARNRRIKPNSRRARVVSRTIVARRMHR